MKIKQFQQAVRFYFFNRLVQTILFVSAALLTFWISWDRLPVWDVSSSAKYSLTPETVSYLQNLPTEIEIIGSLALGESSSLGERRFNQIESLIRRYERVTDKLKVRWVDGFRAQSEYGFESPYEILIRGANSSERITAGELWVQNDTSESFGGERTLTSAIWRVANPQKTRVLIHSTQQRLFEPGQSSFSSLIERLTQQGLEVVRSSDGLGNLRHIDLLMVLGGLETIGGSDLASIQRYLNDSSGSLMIALDQKPTEQVARFLYFNGVELGAYRIEQTQPKDRTAFGESLIRSFGESPVATVAKQNGSFLLSRGQWWVLKARAGAIDRQVLPIATIVDPNTQQPSTIALSLQKSRDDQILQKGVVFGSSDFLSNAYLTHGGNQAILEGTLDWLLERVSFQTIPLRTLQTRQVSLTIPQLWKVGAVVIVCTLVLAGLAVVRILMRPR